MRFLIDRGAGLGDNLLHWAILSENADIGRLVIEAGADPDWEDSRGWSALHHAVWHPDIVAVILEAGADPNAVTFDGVTALSHAIGLHSLDSARLLIEHGADIMLGVDQEAPIIRAVQAGPSFVRLLLDAGFDPSRTDEDLTAYALPSRRPLSDAPARLIRVLIKHGLPVEPPNPPPMAQRAMYLGDIELLHFVVERGADVHRLNHRGETLLFGDVFSPVADWGAHPEWRETLLGLDIDLDHVNDEGLTALMHHARLLHESTVRALLDAGADPTIRTIDGFTARDFAEGVISLISVTTGFSAPLTTEQIETRQRIVSMLEEAMSRRDGLDR